MKKQLITAVGDDYILALKDPHVDYTNVTLRGMLEHLFTVYGGIVSAHHGAQEPLAFHWFLPIFIFSLSKFSKFWVKGKDYQNAAAYHTPITDWQYLLVGLAISDRRMIEV